MSALQELLKDTFGYDDFRPGQETIIRHVLRQENVLGIMPTGGGKSICYQLPALLLDNLTLVISPLISLMKDQVDALNLMGNHRIQLAVNKEVKLLYVAPERLESYDFQQMLTHVPID